MHHRLSALIHIFHNETLQVSFFEKKLRLSTILNRPFSEADVSILGSSLLKNFVRKLIKLIL